MFRDVSVDKFVIDNLNFLLSLQVLTKFLKIGVCFSFSFSSFSFSGAGGKVLCFES